MNTCRCFIIILHSDAFKTPSPGAYSPEKVHPQGEKHAPIYSMGRRTGYRKSKQYSLRQCTTLHFFLNKGDSTPSPNSYTLPCLLGHRVPNKPASSSYSMASRPITGSFSEDLAKTPGPGCYNAIPPNIYTPRAPGYSMLGRSYMPGGNLNMSKTATNIHLLC